MTFPTLDDISLSGKTALVRLDLNVPLADGKITDETRILHSLPTLKKLLAGDARIIVISHLGRPKGAPDPAFSLEPVVVRLRELLPDTSIGFETDPFRDGLMTDSQAEITVLENIRFFAEEESNDAAFAEKLAALGDLFVNDAFSCSHRAHASIVGLAQHLPTVAGEGLRQELDALEKALETPERPVTAIVGGAKVSTKVAVLENLLQKVDTIAIGGGMANTFLLAQGYDIGASLCDRESLTTARNILESAEESGCTILLPEDVMVAPKLASDAPTQIRTIEDIPADQMILDIGPAAIARFQEAIGSSKTVVWNGPMGVFETPPFDTGTVALARFTARQTTRSGLISVAGGGDTVAALNHARVTAEFSTVSTAGGAFLEWLEGKTLPGIEVLMASNTSKPRPSETRKAC